MPRFHCLRADAAIHRDLAGTELPDIAAAHAHAREVAEELMLNSHYGTIGWSLSVEANAGHKPFDLFFAPRLAAFSPEMRLLANETCRTNPAGIEVCNAMRATRIEVRTRLVRAAAGGKHERCSTADCASGGSACGSLLVRMGAE